MGQSRPAFKAGPREGRDAGSDMSHTVSIIMPAFRAGPFIGGGVRSVLAQTYPHWLLYIVGDDGQDYAALLAADGIVDRRLRFLASGETGGGASRARNRALDIVDTPYAAVLDADDRFAPAKLERAVAALAEHAIVTSALDVVDAEGRHLRFVGEGPDRVLSPAEHKFVSISMDSMIVWDRRRCDARYDVSLSNMTDLEFLMQLYRTVDRSFHLGAPLHDYVKRESSMSNGPDVTAGMVRSKQVLIERLRQGHYPMTESDGPEGLAAFLAVSLEAETSYPAALAADPGLLFEDHLEPMLARARP